MDEQMNRRYTDENTVVSMRSTAFLANNPESFGLTSETYPIVGETYIISAHGVSEQHVGTLVHDIGAQTPSEWFESVYAASLVGYDPALADALIQYNFKNWEQWQEQPLSRCGAILCQMLLRKYFERLEDEPIEPNWLAVSEELSDGLRNLHESVRIMGFCSEEVDVPTSAAIGAAYVRRVAEDCFYITMLSAGAFRFYLLDKNGMAPLWLERSYPLSEDGFGRLEMRQVHIEKSEPFAVVVLSENVCRNFRLDHVDDDKLQMQRGLVWRDRMRLERVLLHAVDESDTADRFPECAAHAFGGYIAAGETGASGALSVIGASFERFADMCRMRLQRVEETLELLPDGYDPERRIAPQTLAYTEREFADGLLGRSHALQNYMFDVVSEHLEAMLSPLAMRLEEAYEPLRDDGPLQGNLVEGVFRSYDDINMLDRRQIGVNQHKIEQLLADHWITLRPVFLADQCDEDSIQEKIYTCCLRMNRSLLSMQRKRRECMNMLMAYLQTRYTALSADTEDYILGRAGDDSVYTQMKSLADGVLDATAKVRTQWQSQGDGYRSMLTAYTAERERLFRMDVDRDTFLTYRDIFNGTLPDTEWESLSERVERTLSDDYVALLDVLRALSQHNGQLRSMIVEKDAVGRTCRELAGRRDCQCDALLAILRGENGWTWRTDATKDKTDLHMDSELGRSEGTDVMPASHDIVNHYHALVRRWHEVQKHYARQEEAYTRYRDMYTGFLGYEV